MRASLRRGKDVRRVDDLPPADLRFSTTWRLKWGLLLGWSVGMGLDILLVVACALVDADGRVLLAKRPPGRPLAGLWEFPGGKVESGETPDAAVIRELEEELGIWVSPNCLAPFTFASHSYEAFHLLMPLYVCRKWQGTVKA